MLINECLFVGSLCLGDFVIVAHTNGVSQVEVSAGVSKYALVVSRLHLCNDVYDIDQCVWGRVSLAW